MDITSIYEVSFMCRLHVATSLCRICVQLTWFVSVVYADCLSVVLSVQHSLVQYGLQFCVVQFVVLCSTCVVCTVVFLQFICSVITLRFFFLTSTVLQSQSWEDRWQYYQQYFTGSFWSVAKRQIKKLMPDKIPVENAMDNMRDCYTRGYTRAESQSCQVHCRKQYSKRRTSFSVSKIYQTFLFERKYSEGLENCLLA